MKALNNILIKIIMSSGLFLNATAQDDITGLYIPDEFQSNTEIAFFHSKGLGVDNCCKVIDAETGETNSWIESKKIISITDMPKAILRTLVKEYDAYALLSVEEIETSVREAYKLRVVKDNAEWDIYISSKGDILMEEKVS